MKLPELNRWLQTNNGDIFGVLHSTKGCAFDKAGKLILSKKAFSIYNSDQNPDFGYLLNINHFNDNYVFLTNDELFSGGLKENDTITELKHPPAHGLNADSIIWNDLYHLSTNTSIHTWDGGTTTGAWADRSVSLASGVPHPLEVFASLPEFQLAVGNGNKVALYDTSYNKSSSELILPSEHQVTSIRYRNGFVYVGTKNLAGGDAQVYIWNGDGNAAQYECPVGAAWVFSMVPDGNSVLAVTSKGELGKVEGSSFTVKASFPVANIPDSRWQGATGLLVNGKVFNRGMVKIGERIYINIDGSVESGFIPEMKSGVWVYHPDIGLTHRSSLSADKYFSDTAITVENSVITTSVDHNLKDGDAVFFLDVFSLDGVSSDTTYYAKVTDTNKIKISRSRKALSKENYVTLDGTVTIESLVYVPNDDVGDDYNNSSGAISGLVYNDSSEESWSSEIIFGGRIDNKEGNAKYVLNVLSKSYTVGMFETQRIYAKKIKDSWEKFRAYVDGLLLEGEEVVVKSRLNKKEETKVMSATWVTDRKIRSVLNKRDQDSWEDIEEGFEVVIVDGQGRGYSAHVENIEPTTKTFTLTLDESIGVAGSSLKFYATNYKKHGEYNNEKKESFIISTIPNTTGGWIQFKCEVRGFETEIAINDVARKSSE